MPAEDGDWRVEEAEHLRGARFVFHAWSPPPPEFVEVHRDDDGRVTLVRTRSEPGAPGWGDGDYPVWDHDHCEACWQRLTNNPDYEDGEPYGWRTGEGEGIHTWVCGRCFEDLREQLDWKA